MTIRTQARAPAPLVVVAALTGAIAACEEPTEGEPAASPPGEAPTSTVPEPPEPGDLDKYTADLTGDGPLVAELETTEGQIRCELFSKEAPRTVANFVGLARGLKAWRDPEDGTVTERPLYDGTIFHRVIPQYLIQGGDPRGDGHGGPGYRFDDEIDSELGHGAPGTLSMANAGPDTNGSQFFITETPQPQLDGQYAVFGRCGDLEVVETIARAETAAPEGVRPADDVILESVTITREEAAASE